MDRLAKIFFFVTQVQVTEYGRASRQRRGERGRR